jgi:hypothetical protein
MSKAHYWLSLEHPDKVPNENAGAAANTWYKSDSFRRYPLKSQVRAAVETVLDGWTPAAPLIGPTTRVVALGSCFAAHFVEWLMAHGYNQLLKDDPYAAVLQNAFEAPSVVAQQFRWAFGEFDPNHALWFDKSKRLVDPTEERRLALRALLERTDVLVVTLGLSEVWYDKSTGEPLWRVMPIAYHDPSRHAFKVQSVAETVRALETIDRLRAAHLPNLKILYTVSPLRLRATFRPVSAVTANAVSKAVLRAALDEFLRDRSDLNRTYFYFPSYEIVTDVLLDPFADEQMHLHEHAISFVLATFARHFTSLSVTDPAPAPAAPADERLVQIEKAYIERLHQLASAKHACGALTTENAVLHKACAERLDLINRLTAEIERLRRTCDERLAVINRLAKPAA